MELQPTRASLTHPSQAVQGSKGTFFLFVIILLAGRKGAGRLFHGRKGRQIQEALSEMVLCTCSELGLSYPILSYPALLYSYCILFLFYSVLFYSFSTLFYSNVFSAHIQRRLALRTLILSRPGARRKSKAFFFPSLLHEGGLAVAQSRTFSFLSVLTLFCTEHSRKDLPTGTFPSSLHVRSCSGKGNSHVSLIQ